MSLKLIDVHKRTERDVARFENGLALAVDDRVVGVDGGVDILLHYIPYRQFCGKKLNEVVVGAQPVRVVCAHAVIGLDYDGIADLVYELFACPGRIGKAVARRLYARFGIEWLHLRL